MKTTCFSLHTNKLTTIVGNVNGGVIGGGMGPGSSVIYGNGYGVPYNVQ